MTPLASKAAGFTLMEVMLALAVSSIAMLAAVQLHAHAGAMYRSSQAERSLEETARLTLTMLRRDIELAGYLAFAQGNRVSADEAGPAIVVRNDCGTHWAIRLAAPIEGHNNGYRWTCTAYRNSPAVGADSLTLRYVDPQQVIRFETGALYLESNAGGAGRVFAARRGADRTEDPLAAVNALRTLGYYVSTTSAGSEPGDPIPSLRVKRLSADDRGPRILDEEIQPGIQDLQIEFGIDTDGSEDPDYGRIDRFVAPGDVDAAARVLAVRIWLLVRSPWREPGVPARTIPGYADQPQRTWRDGIRRRLVTTTIAIDDARPW